MVIGKRRPAVGGLTFQEAVSVICWIALLGSRTAVSSLSYEKGGSKVTCKSDISSLGIHRQVAL
jgi:hypothetical protein